MNHAAPRCERLQPPTGRYWPNTRACTGRSRSGARAWSRSLLARVGLVQLAQLPPTCVLVRLRRIGIQPVGEPEGKPIDGSALGGQPLLGTQRRVLGVGKPGKL